MSAYVSIHELSNTHLTLQETEGGIINLNSTLFLLQVGLLTAVLTTITSGFWFS